MGKIAFIFPGQGSQSVGMGKELYDNLESSKSIYNKFNEVLGFDITKICFEGPEEDLKQTKNTQPAILATSLAALEAFKEKSSIRPDYVAGHSLGEYGAFFTAGVLNLEDTIKLIGKRAELMNQTTGGAMSAILNLSEDKINEAIKTASSDGIVTVANYNTPDQIVITGEDAPVAKANELCSEAGAKRVVLLPVSGAFHSPLMKKASESYTEFVNQADIQDALIPVITNVDAKETIDKDDFAAKMVEQIYSSVYWTQTIKYLSGQGVDTFIEMGPGRVLAGMNRKMAKEFKTYNVYDLKSLENTITAINA